MGGYAWTQAERDYLDDFYRAFESPEAEEKFYRGLAKVSGHKRTKESVHYMAMKMGLLKREQFALPTLREVAAELDVQENTLSKLILTYPDRFPVTRTSKYTFVPESTQNKLVAFYARPDTRSLEGTVTSAEAAERLNVDLHTINLWLRFGALEGLKDGRIWRVTVESIRRAKYLQERHGKYWLKAIADELTPTYHRHQVMATANGAKKRAQLKERLARSLA